MLLSLIPPVGLCMEKRNTGTLAGKYQSTETTEPDDGPTSDYTFVDGVEMPASVMIHSWL